MSERRVAITGLGLLTPCGQGWKPYWEATLESRSCIRNLSNIQVDSLPVHQAGEIMNFDPAVYVKQRKSLKVMSREIQLAVAASHLAVEDAAIRLEEIDRSRFGVSLGTGVINTDLDEIAIGIQKGMDSAGIFRMTKFGQEGVRALFPLWFLKYLPNMPACHISIAHGLTGPSNTVTTSAAAGAQALGEAYHVIRRGDADVMIAGSTDSKINAMGISRFHLLGLLSPNGENPETAYRPFDERHSGVVLGEGAGLIILEEWEHARRRGAHIYGEMLGYGSSSDFNYNPAITEDFTGKKLAMSRALHDAQVDSKEIDFLVANGSGIPMDDVQEAQAIRSVFQSSMDRLRVTNVKPITGHLVYGSAGVEIGAALLALRDGVIPSVANLEKPDEACELPFVMEKPSYTRTRAFLFNSFGFGGQNAALVVRKAS
jgi:3-oxoacyl-[acyl-carrier-protein] synthase II